MSTEPNYESKFPNMATLSRAERDQIVLNALEVIANELNRLSKKVEEIAKKV